jgi:hypothetical protein
VAFKAASSSELGASSGAFRRMTARSQVLHSGDHRQAACTANKIVRDVAAERLILLSSGSQSECPTAHVKNACLNPKN